MDQVRISMQKIEGTFLPVATKPKGHKEKHKTKEAQKPSQQNP